MGACVDLNRDPADRVSGGQALWDPTGSVLGARMFDWLRWISRTCCVVGFNRSSAFCHVSLSLPPPTPLAPIPFCYYSMEYHLTQEKCSENISLL